MKQLTGADAPCADLCYCERGKLNAAIERLRFSMRVNLLRWMPHMSHEEIDAEIDRISRGDEQSAPEKPKPAPRLHSDRDGCDPPAWYGPSGE